LAVDSANRLEHPQLWRGAAVLSVAGFALGDFERLSLFRAFTIADALLLAACALVIGSMRVPRIPGWYWYAALLFTFGTALSLFAVTSPQILLTWGFHAYLYLAVIPLAWMLARRDLRTVRAAAVGLIAALALVSLEAMWRIGRDHLLWWQGVAVPILGGLASSCVLVIGTMLAVYVFVTEWIERRRTAVLSVTALAAVSITAAVILSNKRSDWASLIQATALTIVFFATRRRYAAALIVILALAVGAAVATAPANLRERFVSAAVSVFSGNTSPDSSYRARTLAEQRVMRAIHDGPPVNLLVGYGYRRSPAYVGPDLVIAATPNVHNMFIHYFAETGLIGAAPLLVLWLVPGWTAVWTFVGARASFHRSSSTEDRKLAALAGISAIIMASLWVEVLFTPDMYLRSACFVYGVLMAVAPRFTAGTAAR
jgi:hypothetical protein